MMLLLTCKHQRKIAFVFLILFYLNFITPGVLSAANPPVSRRSAGSWQLTDGSWQSGSRQSGSRQLAVGNWQSGRPAINDLLTAGHGNYRELTDGLLTAGLPTDRLSTDIDGPGQPEMKSFQSVNSNNMVDLFTGDFSYNIPLLDVGGYPVNLHYSSGVTMDQEASWVGLGWNVNPGSISRSMRGLPDDFDGINDSLKKTQHIKENRTTGVTIEPSLEVVGRPIDVSARLGVFYNSYNGYGIETGVGIGGTGRSSFGSLTGNLSISNNSQQGIRISPSLSAKLSASASGNSLRGSLGISTGYSSRAGIASIQIDGGVQASVRVRKTTVDLPSINFPVSGISFAVPSYSPTINMPLKNYAFSFTGKIGGEVWGTDGSLSFTGYTNQQSIANEDTTQVMPAAGYIYSTNGNNREDVLLDFNREKETEFNYKTTPHIAMPQYTYDAFSISGEGTGGSFRPYRGDIGYIFDHNIVTRDTSENASMDIGFGAAVHGGFEITNMSTKTSNHRWNNDNQMASSLAFQSADTTYEPVYFRNPGEKTTNDQSYYRAIGDDSLVRVKLGGTKEYVYAENAFIKYDDEGRRHEELQVTGPLVKKQRDKRSQVISYFTAEDASVLGLDKTILSYQENSVPVGQCSGITTAIPRVDNRVRKRNHLSEISVLNSDGRKYVYGLPIYNRVQKDVTFAVDAQSGTPDPTTGLINYNANQDNTTRNTRGKDNYFLKEETPAYAHNFLLTGIVSPDYADITGNGISEDDPGDAVKFNYTQVYGGAQGNGYYLWRTPFKENNANYNEGLKTYNQDDKATYLYGEKEIWYLNSIESKTMIAVFRITNNRLDAYSVKGENGGLNTGKSTRRLDSIHLYVKADIIKNGIANAKPVKTVHFSYNYELCKGAQGDIDTGKLTLKSVWFTYNKNNKGKLNPYTFSYHPDADGNPQTSYNPSFNSRNSDRWGTFKDQADNPDDMSNADFPYSKQDSTKAAQNASVWNLTDIHLPSGGKMHITYEADDYGYVQNKRATQMNSIAGIGEPAANKLYNFSSNGKEDYYTIYITTPDVLKNKADIRNKYLDIDEVVYFKLAITMPPDQFGSGEEMVPGYGTIEDYGISATDNKQFWIKLAPVEGSSPMTRAALQFLRLNLRSKAYPGSEGVDKLGFLELIKMMATSVSEINNMVNGFDGAAKKKNLCNVVDLDRSFVRLSNPSHKKYGGGYRVKRVEIYDNWKKMTDQRESVYGQEYTYTTTEDVDGMKKTISSGVATYEPAIGGEENPFRRPISYVEKAAPMAPVNFMFSEEPLGETFFPSPMVGYSKVRVRTINAKARSANGWEETEYFTSRDFPTLVEHTFLEEGSSKFKYETTSDFLRLNHKNYITLSQGFKVELNDMNGKLKAQSTYAETDSINPMSYSLNFYKVDDDRTLQKHLNNQVWVVDSANGTINTQGQIGKDIEMMTDLREQRSQAHTKGFSPNVDWIAPFPFIGALPLLSKINLPQKEDTRYRSAAVVKIVQRYGILDSVVVMDKGSVVSTKNMVYDAETGNVLLSRTNNEFNDPIYNFNYPAYWAYSGMDPAYKNIGAVFQDKDGAGSYLLNEGILYKGGDTERYPAKRFFESGDEVYVYNAMLATVDPADCRRLISQPEAAWKGKLWVIDAEKGLEKDKGLYFIDSLGRVAPNMVIRKMMIVRSGKRNMQDVSAGNVVMLNNPVKEMPGGGYKIVIDSNARVLNASAAAFRDMWKVENSEYQEDSCYTVYRTSSDSVFYPLGQSAVFRSLYLHYDHEETLPLGNIYSPHFVASAFKRHHKRWKFKQFNLRSVLKFDLRTISAKPGVVVSNAMLKLAANAPTQVWVGVTELPDFTPRTKAHYEWETNEGALAGKTNESIIRRVIADWNLNFGYDDVLTDPSGVIVPRADDQTCVDRDLDVTTLVSGMVASPETNHGFAIDISDGGDNGEPNTSERTQTYCSVPNLSKTSVLATPVTGECVECIGATLVVNYSYYKDTCVKVCRQNISDTATNPYRWGILGNWRMDRSYVYYNERQETDATVKETDIRIEGELKDFVPYWFFTDSSIVPHEDTTRWVWNSAISAFNRKGFEIENYDPLGRYNAGLYGYNQTLPVAVAQNSRYRELLFDGFEDYGYKTNSCIDCPPKREFEFKRANGVIDTTRLQSHTGLYSIKVNSGSESLLSVPVASDTATGETALSAKIDSMEVNSVTVNGTGTGLWGAYYFGAGIGNFCISSNRFTYTQVDPSVNFNWGSVAPGPPGAPFCPTSFSATWTGTLQPRYTDLYTFHMKYSGTASLNINGITLHSSTNPETGEWSSDQITLQAGKLYRISLSYTKTSSRKHGEMVLSWSGLTAQPREIIPTSLLYPALPADADTAGSINYSLHHYCVNAHDVVPENVIRDKFSPFTDSRLTVSAWVRLDVEDCNNTPSLDSVIQVNYNTGGTPVWLKKTGLRIEGWQRYEANVDMPPDTATMYIRLKTLANTGIYVDDIRVQPFSSSMKSFVYNRDNLRLMAELDENNYASFYEYDDDGTLIRVKKETERGIMTVQETRSALFKE